MSILRPHGDQPPDVAFYVPKSRTSWHVQVQSNLFTHPSIIVLDIITETKSFLVIKVSRG